LKQKQEGEIESKNQNAVKMKETVELKEKRDLMLKKLDLAIASVKAVPAGSVSEIAAKYDSLREPNHTLHQRLALNLARNQEMEAFCKLNQARNPLEMVKKGLGLNQSKNTAAKVKKGRATKQKSPRGKKFPGKLRVPETIAMPDQEVVVDSNDEEEGNADCDLNHGDIANFKKIEEPSYASQKNILYRVPCKTCHKRFNHVLKESMSSDSFVVPSGKNPAHICANEGRGCRVAMCHTCYTKEVVGELMRTRKTRTRASRK
jgi:hypothetical protein